MTSSLCDLVSLPELWGSCVLSKLKIQDIVRFDTALLNSHFDGNLVDSCRFLPPICLPFIKTVDHLGFALSWIFSRGIFIDTMCLQLEFLKSGSLQNLLADYIDNIKGDISVSCSEDLTMLSTAAYFIRQVLDAKVDNVLITLPPTPEHLPDDFLPFHNMKFLSWSESQPETDGQCLVSVIASSARLDGLCVRRDEHLPEGFFEALSRRRDNLLEVQYNISLLTDQDLHQTAQICANLVVLVITLPPDTVGHITDAGIIAVAECCRKLEEIETHNLSLTGASLAALLTHCVHLTRAKCEGAEFDEDGLLALCGPDRVAHLQEFACSWAVTVHLDVSYSEKAFSALRRFWVSKVTPGSCNTLCAALRVMPKLQDVFVCPEIAQQPMPIPVDVLIALAEGSPTGLVDVNIAQQIVGDAECSLVAIVQKSRNLCYLHIDNVAEGLTDAVVYALAEYCGKLEYLHLNSAKLVTDNSVTALASKCPRLDFLILRKCKGLTDRSIVALAQHCPALWHLDVTDSAHKSEFALTKLLQSCPQIVTLNVAPASVTKAAVQRLQENMEVEGAVITRAEVPVLTRVAGTVTSIWKGLVAWWSESAWSSRSAVHPL
jgi:hypothetical protein